MKIEQNDIESATGVKLEIKTTIEDRTQNPTHEVQIYGQDGKWFPIIGMDIPTRIILIALSETEQTGIMRHEIVNFREIKKG
jgi:hypothetical protein